VSDKKPSASNRVGGKAPRTFMQRVVFESLGRRSRRVKLGPGVGIDYAVVSAGKGGVLVLTTDPVSVLPLAGMKTSAWLSVHLVASDYTTSGLDPEFASFSYNFPPELDDSEKEEYVRAVGAVCDELGVSIIAGNTGTYPGAGFTVIGAGTMLGFGKEGGYIAPTMAKAGDHIVMTKGAAIESAATLALSFPAFTEKALGAKLASKAGDLVTRCSTVKDARVARLVGLGREGVTSMHDATEGGVLGGLAEMAAASQKGIVVALDRILVPEVVSKVGSLFGFDPLTSPSEGTLLLTCSQRSLDAVLKKLRRSGVEATEIGHVEEGEGVWASRERSPATRVGPVPDSYWAAYQKASEAGLG
jgi:hydrogenase expression/formation protein HypE